MQACGKAVSADAVANRQVVGGDQVVRRDQRARLFAGKVFALPLPLQMRSRQLLLGFSVVVGLGCLAFFRFGSYLRETCRCRRLIRRAAVPKKRGLATVLPAQSVPSP